MDGVQSFTKKKSHTTSTVDTTKVQTPCTISQTMPLYDVTTAAITTNNNNTNNNSNNKADLKHCMYKPINKSQSSSSSSSPTPSIVLSSTSLGRRLRATLTRNLSTTITCPSISPGEKAYTIIPYPKYNEDSNIINSTNTILSPVKCSKVKSSITFSPPPDSNGTLLYRTAKNIDNISENKKSSSTTHRNLFTTSTPNSNDDTENMLNSIFSTVKREKK